MNARALILTTSASLALILLGTSVSACSGSAQRVAVDTVLADSGSIVAGAAQRRDTFELIAFRKAQPGRALYRSGPIPYLPRVEISQDRHVLLWSFAGNDLLGGVAVYIGGDSAKVVRQQWSPAGGLCGVPHLRSEGQRTYLITPVAAVFPASWCTDEAQDCVGQFHSTWPEVGLVTPSGLESGRAPTGFYDSLAQAYRAEAAQLGAGEVVRGQNLSRPETIIRRCGSMITDSLKSLAKRADSLAHRR